MKMFCLTIFNDHFDKIKKLGYLPVGLGENIKSNEFINDKTKINISKKNPFYGEYTFHYWLWKNDILSPKDEWIGFCQYRKYWSFLNDNKNIKTLEQLSQNILREIPKSLSEYESILVEPFYVNQFRFSKFIKKNLSTMIKEPSLFFNKDKRNIRFHFDMMHGKGNLDKAIDLLDKKDKKDFLNYVNSNVFFYPHNMFICKSSDTLKQYYNSIFPWLERCEKVFGFSLEGYGLKRIYGFLAERFMSYWFSKYTKFTTLPIIFKDLNEVD